MSHSGLLIAQLANRAVVPGFLLLMALLPGSVVAAQFIDIEIDSATYRVELARTPAERRQGLMMRQSLDRFSGMLLVYPKLRDHRIWMKNMLIPLRVYWIDSDFNVVGTRRLEPCLQDPCPVYSVSQRSLYVLELSDHGHNLKPGDRIDGLTDL